MARHIKFLALAHDSKILASHTHWDKENREDYEAQLGNVFKTGQWGELMGGAKRKFELTSNGAFAGLALPWMSAVDQTLRYVLLCWLLRPRQKTFTASSSMRSGAFTCVLLQRCTLRDIFLALLLEAGTLD
jgi:hypothetical protein